MRRLLFILLDFTAFGRAALEPAPPALVEFTIVTGPEAADLGTFVLELNASWAPLGTQRLLELVEAKFYDQARFFRVLPKFMAQFGMAAHPKVHAAWSKRKIRDDPVAGSNVRGTVSFAMSGPHTRTTQLFVNTVDNRRLDKEGFAPIGVVVRGMETVGRINSKHKELPSQGKISIRGNAYLTEAFPDLSYVVSARVLVPGPWGGDGRTLVACSLTGASSSPVVVLDVREDWAPVGAARFLDLVASRALDRAAFYRAIPNFVAQLGVPRDASLRARWLGNAIPDDPPNGVPFAKGTLSFAASGPASRDCELAFSLGHLSYLGKAPWERVVAFVVEGSSSLEAIYTGYGDVGPTLGRGPEQARVRREGGYEYLARAFPRLSSLDTCRVVSAHGNSPWAQTRKWAGPGGAVAASNAPAAAVLLEGQAGARTAGGSPPVDPLALLYLLAGGAAAFFVAVLIAALKGNTWGTPIDRER
jgi:cyclophilin family peptidyl-prolyl cis-trans isomerase